MTEGTDDEKLVDAIATQFVQVMAQDLSAKHVGQRVRVRVNATTTVEDRLAGIQAHCPLPNRVSVRLTFAATPAPVMGVLLGTVVDRSWPVELHTPVTLLGN